MAEQRVALRPLESALFGVRVAAATVTSASDVPSVLEAARAQSADVTIVRVPSEVIEAVQAVEAHGGRLCDVLVSFARTIPEGGLAVDPGHRKCIVRPGSAGDAQDLHALAVDAFAGFPGHWHADARLRKADADELYGRWAADLSRRPDACESLLVSQTDSGEITGFLALAPEPRDGWHVSLTAVHPRRRGQGTLRELIVAATSRVARLGPTRLLYETQLANWPAIGVVSRCGFAPVASRMTFHLWAEDA